MTTTETAPRPHDGKALRCAHCSGDKFRVREYALRTYEDETLRVPWSADNVKAYICEQCGSIIWFA